MTVFCRCPVHGLSIDELCVTYCGAENLSRSGMVGGENPSRPPFGGLHETPGRDRTYWVSGGPDEGWWPKCLCGARAWGDGEWQTEPDKVQWVDEATGYDCIAVRTDRSGHWCGYVGLPPEHPCQRSQYDDVRVPDEDGNLNDWPEVHGGLTYSGLCQEGTEESEGICHVPLDGRPDKVWWLGFDCAHSGDFSPAYAARYKDDPLFQRGSWEQYRTLDYVQWQTRKLAAQLVASSPKSESDSRDA